jgi:hypothetical protein
MSCQVDLIGEKSERHYRINLFEKNWKEKVW